MTVDAELTDGPFLGLDWFLLNLIVYSLIFIPIERLFARLPEQGVFRPGAPGVSPDAGALALPRHSPFCRADGLARGIASASG